MQRRQTKKTRFVYCKGAHDKAFLDCLKSVYASDTYNVDIKRGAGGDQVHLAVEAIKKGRAYDEKYLKIDGDRPVDEMNEAEKIANDKDNKLTVIKTIPCLERLLINILEPSKSVTSWSSTRLKSYFERNYIPVNKRVDVREYKKIFTKTILDDARARLSELDVLVNIF